MDAQNGSAQAMEVEPPTSVDMQDVLNRLGARIAELTIENTKLALGFEEARRQNGLLRHQLAEASQRQPTEAG